MELSVIASSFGFICLDASSAFCKSLSFLCAHFSRSTKKGNFISSYHVMYVENINNFDYYEEVNW